MHLPRFRIRTLMIAVAVVAALLAAETTRRRWAELATEYRNSATFHSALAEVYRSGALLVSRAEDRAETSRMVAHQLRLVEKYRLAARRPWLSVPPDPPEPK